MTRKIFGREPTLAIAVIASFLSIAGTLGFRFLNAEQAALIVAALYATLGAINAYAVRPVSPVAFTYAIGAFLTLGAAYGLDVPQETAGMIGASVVPLLAFITRGQVTPADTAISRESTALEVAREVGAPGPSAPVA